MRIFLFFLFPVSICRSWRVSVLLERYPHAQAEGFEGHDPHVHASASLASKVKTSGSHLSSRISAASNTYVLRKNKAFSLFYPLPPSIMHIRDTVARVLRFALRSGSRNNLITKVSSTGDKQKGLVSERDSRANEAQCECRMYTTQQMQATAKRFNAKFREEFGGNGTTRERERESS